MLSDLEGALKKGGCKSLDLLQEWELLNSTNMDPHLVDLIANLHPESLENATNPNESKDEEGM